MPGAEEKRTLVKKKKGTAVAPSHSPRAGKRTGGERARKEELSSVRSRLIGYRDARPTNGLFQDLRLKREKSKKKNNYGGP